MNTINCKSKPKEGNYLYSSLHLLFFHFPLFVKKKYELLILLIVQMIKQKLVDACIVKDALCFAESLMKVINVYALFLFYRRNFYYERTNDVFFRRVCIFFFCSNVSYNYMLHIAPEKWRFYCKKKQFIGFILAFRTSRRVLISSCNNQSTLCHFLRCFWRPL